MKTTLKLAIITFVIASFSCSEKQSEQSKAFDAQMKETIQIHDDVMPKMSNINSMISKLQAKKETIENTEDTETYNEAIADLKVAHDLMMSWMKRFSNSFSRTEINQGLTTKNEDSIAAKLEQLDLQYQSAEEMKAAINRALENAKTLLKE